MSILQDQASLKFRSLKNTHLWHLLFLLSATVVIIFFFVGKCLGPTFPESFVWPKDPDSLMSLGEKPTSVRHKEEIEILKKSKSRMYIKQTTEDLVLFLNDHMVKLRNIAKNPGKDKFKEFEQIINYGIEHAEGYKRIIVKEFEELAQQDGSYTLQKKEKKLLEDIVQERLYHLQNPKNCSDAPVLLCDLTNPYGFASGIHDVLWCFIKAYHSKQMLVLVTTKWHYTKTNWEETFQPLSEKCSLDDVNLKNAPRGPGKNSPTVRGLLTKLPSDITPRLVRIHDNPMAWWYGQFMYYLMRPNQHLNSFLDRKSKNISFDTSVAGIHVRRTDKIRSEAKSHAVEEYMNYVEDHFRSLELKSKEVKRKVFVATDEPAVIRELKQKFPSYTFIYNPSNANLASNFSTRYSNDSFWGILADVFMLAKSDILVCTLSSGLCRVAYELMQVLRDDLPRVHSLDVEYHYAYVRPPLRRAVYDHNQLSEKETSFKKGDILVPDHRLGLSDAVHGKTNNGFLIRTNKRTNKGGQIPAYKTEPIYELEDFPSF